ncbi:TetR family transcriptional regulator [Lysinibacillus sp. KCTC 33748]|uniref:TetR/AcrR family transcriptional regulator n=1 Tax=unclassified Lysinibacillus TaxID=2636778 RepID=UPI0009A73119|nr:MULTISPECIES: TetR/AcrR family transcriptional regulator [unclassified Lysinibacillus]OXS66989.1 TetR family transcriptional regulator [Lysinibacillus sp. KCTC 33748]SKC16231.1 transcriptional regulator, TetR family [Lysinibacillus sp. AC-3]
MKSNERQLDLRIRRTHKLLWEALFELMTQPKQKYSAITINQICDRAMVHRTTFYQHFEDKNALLEFGLKQTLEEALTIPLLDRLTKPFQATEQFLRHKEIGKIIESQMDDEQFINFMAYQAREMKKQENEELQRICKNHTIPSELIIEFHSGVLTTLSAWWLQNRKEVSAKEMDQYFHAMINQDIFQFEKE